MTCHKQTRIDYNRLELCRTGECNVVCSMDREKEKDSEKHSFNSEEQIQTLQTNKQWENSSPQETLKETLRSKEGKTLNNQRHRKNKSPYQI